MFFVLHKSWQWPQHACRSARLVLAMSLLLALGGVAAQSALAAGTPFQRGDVFLTSNGGVLEYSPNGQLVQTVPGTSTATRADALCFDASGSLIVPGVGLFDNTGNALPSKWASVTAGYRCVADGFGNVYVGTWSSSTLSGPFAITKYDRAGNPIQTFDLTLSGAAPLGMDLAPDECTMFVGDYRPVGNGQLNVCTGTQSGPAAGNEDIRVLPNWQTLQADDVFAYLANASGQPITIYNGGGNQLTSSQWLRDVSLDPDGTSFWSCCSDQLHPPPTTYDATRWDISSGRLLSEWPVAQGAVNYPNGFNVYGPPLLGNANISRSVDSNTAGTAEAFVTTARYSGQMSRLHLYLDFSSTASQVVVGIYTNRNGHPGILQKQAAITDLRAGSWNYVDVPPPPMSVTAGQRHWIAVLGPIGAGRIRFRDAASGPGSETSSQHNLTALPATWSTGKAWATGNLSAYGS